MRRVLPLTLAVIVLSCLAVAASRSVTGLRELPGARRTIEPTLPVTIDLRLVQVDRRPAGGTARLEALIDADRSVSAVEITLRLPAGVSAAGGDLEPGRPVALRASGRRLLAASLQTARNEDLPIQIVASFRLPDGTPVISRQGVTLRLGPSRPAGRMHLGAYEMMAVPAPDLAR